MQVMMILMLVTIIFMGINYLTGIGIDIQKLIIANPPKMGLIPTGRMSPLTAAGFAISISAFYLLAGRVPNKRHPSVSTILSFLLIILSGVNILGYLYGAPLFYGGTFIPVALTTALCFFFLNCNIIFSAGPNYWPVNVFVGPSIKARVVRVFIPLAIVIVLIQGFLSANHEFWKIGTALRYALATIVTLAIFIAMIALLAKMLDKEIEQSDNAKIQAENTLKQSEARFRTLVETANDGIININSDGMVVFWNHAAESIFGYSAEEMIGRFLNQIMPQEFVNSHSNALIRVHNTGETHLIGKTVEVSGVRKNGNVFPLMLSLASWKVDGEGFYTGIIRDITQRKRFELVQNATLRISQATLTSEGMDELYSSIHTILKELLPANNIFIALYDANTDSIDFPYYIDQYDEKPTTAFKADGLTGYVIHSGKSLLATPEIYDDLVEKKFVTPIGTRPVEWLGVPLKLEGRIIGVITIQSYEEGIHFNQQDMDLLEFVSTQVAQAIDRKRLENEIRALSLSDPLTGLYNRRGFTILAEQEFRLAHRKERSMILFFGDVDKLKYVNDTFGHAQGDLVLKDIAAVLKECFREADIIARIGGDEFVVLALDASQETEDVMIDRIQESINNHNQQRVDKYPLTISIGSARYDWGSTNSINDLLDQADAQMYKQKQAHRALINQNNI